MLDANVRQEIKVKQIGLPDRKQLEKKPREFMNNKHACLARRTLGRLSGVFGAGIRLFKGIYGSQFQAQEIFR
jgi:hypothetical protein